MSSRIEKYLGFPAGLSGGDLARRGEMQAQRFGVEILAAEAAEVRTEGPYRIIKLADGDEIFLPRALMIATGVQWRRLDAPGHRSFAGCPAFTMAAARRKQYPAPAETIYVIGGANSAGQAAMNFARSTRTKFLSWFAAVLCPAPCRST